MNGNKKEILIILFWLLIITNVFWFGSRLVNYVVNGGETPEGEPVANHVEIKESSFYQSQISEENQEAYETLRQGLMERSDNIVLDNCSGDELESIWGCVLNDHPEIFWVNSYRYYETKGETTFCEVLPDYCYTGDDIEERQAKIEEFTDEFLKGISRGESDYNKILYTYEYIIDRTDYDLEAPNNQHIDSVILGKSSVCAGYAKTTKYLLNQLGVECTYVTGMAGREEKEAHAWTIVTCEGDYYYLDTTWGDPVYQSKEDEENAKYSNITYDYMCCNEDELFKTHTLDEGFEYPSCTKNDWNYYVVNGRYFTEYSADEISTLIQSDIEGKKVISEFKFADSSVYEAAKEDLLGEQLQNGKKMYDEANGTQGTQCYYKDDSKHNKIVIYWE